MRAHPVDLSDHRRRKVGLNHVTDLRPRQASRDLAGVTAEDQGRTEGASDISETLDDTLGHLVDEKVKVGEPGRRPVSTPSQQPAVEDFGRLVGNYPSSEARTAPRDAMK